MVLEPVDRRLEPHLIVVSGQAGSGKTTLAHRLAESIGCPAICRDEIKEGMVHAYGRGFEAATNDPLTARTYPLFFDCVRLLLEGGVTVVAEAAFQHRLWVQGLEPLLALADLRIVRCAVDDDVLLRRRHRRLAEVATRSAHADADVLTLQPDWDAIHLEAPTLDVDTTDGYRPSLEQIADFAAS
jgi:predicted kinase